MADTYSAKISWIADAAMVRRGRYTRAHTWSFDGGLTIPASASPSIVPVPMSDASAVDPEEALIASASACHMLWFVDLARRAGFFATRYEDDARGRMLTDADGRVWIDRIDLSPKVVWDGDAPDNDTLAKLHETAHRSCFIANSLRSDVVTHLG